MAGAIAALGGALLAGGMSVVAYDTWAGGGAAAIPPLLTAAVLATSLLALAPSPSFGTALVPAAVAASGLIAPALAFFVLSTGGEFPSLRAVALLGGLVLGALYLAGPAPGHGFHLAVLAAAAWLAAVAVAGPGGSLLGRGTLADALVTAGVVSLVVGLAELAAAWWLDRAGLAGMATPLLGVGSAAAVVGASVVWQESGALAGAALLALAAAAQMGAARPAGRRGPLWAAAATAGAGAVALADAVVAGGGVAARALVVALVGVILAGAAAAAGRSAYHTRDGDVG